MGCLAGESPCLGGGEGLPEPLDWSKLVVEALPLVRGVGREPLGIRTFTFSLLMERVMLSLLFSPPLLPFNEPCEAYGEGELLPALTPVALLSLCSMASLTVLVKSGISTSISSRRVSLLLPNRGRGGH